MSDVPLSSVKRGGGATTYIYNAFTSAGFTAAATMSVPAEARSSVSGALTANTLVDLLNESGSAGQIDHLSIYTNDSTARTMRVVITRDGIQILDVTSASISATNSGGVWAGVRGTGSTFQLPPIKYNSSIRVQYASNQNETGKFTLGLAYQRST